MLQETSSELAQLNNRDIRSASRVAQAIIECSSDINDYLLEFSVTFCFLSLFLSTNTSASLGSVSRAASVWSGQDPYHGAVHPVTRY